MPVYKLLTNHGKTMWKRKENILFGAQRRTYCYIIKFECKLSSKN